MAMIEVQDLKKSYGPIQAVRGVTFEVDRGEVVGFLGPNGAGKSTVMRMLTCFLPPTGGTAKAGGFDIQDQSIEVRKLIGYLPESNPLYGDMSTVGFLKFIAKMREIPAEERDAAIERVIKICQLEGVRTQMLETLSKGFKRRVGLAQALIHDPEILILDEPTDGLDPNQKHEVRQLINSMAKDKVIIISTHILEEVEAICTRAIVIAQGSIVADSVPSDLRARSKYHGATQLTLAKGDLESLRSVLEKIEGVDTVEPLEHESNEALASSGGVSFLLYPKNGANLAGAIVRESRERDWDIVDLHVQRGHLDEVFRDITLHGGQS